METKATKPTRGRPANTTARAAVTKALRGAPKRGKTLAELLAVCGTSEATLYRILADMSDEVCCSVTRPVKYRMHNHAK